MIQKPINFEARVFIDEFGERDEERFDLIHSLGDPYGFHIDHDCGAMFYTSTDSTYASLESRVVYLLKRIKEERLKLERCLITGVLFDSKIHGLLI